MCSFAPASRASNVARWMASSSAITGRDARKASDASVDRCDAPVACVSLLTLRVHRDRQAEPRCFAQSLEQSKIVGARKLGQTGIAQERLEADDTAVG